MALDLTNFHDLPGKQQVAQFLRVRFALRDHLEVFFRHPPAVHVLHQQAAGDALEIEARGPGFAPGTGGEYAHVGLGGEDRFGVRRHLGGDDDLDELALEDGLGGGRVEWPVEGDDAAEGRGRVGDVGVFVGIEHRVGHGDAAGVGVLHNHARGFVETLHAFERGVGVGDIVVGELPCPGGCARWRHRPRPAHVRRRTPPAGAGSHRSAARIGAHDLHIKGAWGTRRARRSALMAPSQLAMAPS